MLPLDDHESATIVPVNEIHARKQEMLQSEPIQNKNNQNFGAVQSWKKIYYFFPKSEVYPSNGPNRSRATLEWWHLHVLDPHQVGSKREARQLPGQSMWIQSPASNRLKHTFCPTRISQLTAMFMWKMKFKPETFMVFFIMFKHTHTYTHIYIYIYTHIASVLLSFCDQLINSAKPHGQTNSNTFSPIDLKKNDFKQGQNRRFFDFLREWWHCVSIDVNRECINIIQLNLTPCQHVLSTGLQICFSLVF